MKLFTFALKNALLTWWRSLTLGLFVFFVCLSMTLFSAVTTGIGNKIDNVISDGITGHIQVRSDKSMENDMAVQQKTGWDALVPIRPEAAERISALIRQSLPEAAQTRLARQSVYLENRDKREQCMLLGVVPEESRYQNAFLITQGAYLRADSFDEILLTREQAQIFKKNIGDCVRVTTKNQFGRNVVADLTVAGIGDFILLSMFSYKAAYVSDKTVQRLMGYDTGQWTDIIAYLPDATMADAESRRLGSLLTKAGMETVISLDEKFESADRRTDALPSADEYMKNAKIKISSHTEMGEFFKLTGKIIHLFLNVLLIFLLVITSFLIMNLVHQTGIERYREIGTLRAIGFKKSRVVSIFMTEVMLITLVFAAAGVIASLFIVLAAGPEGVPAPFEEMKYLMGERLSLALAPAQIALITGLVFGFTALAAFYPAFRACSLDPAATIRKE